MTPQILIVSEESKSWLEEEYKHTHDDSDGEHVCILHERVIDEKRKKRPNEQNGRRQPYGGVGSANIITLGTITTRCAFWHKPHEGRTSNASP